MLTVGDVFTTEETQLNGTEITGRLWVVGPEGFRHEVVPLQLTESEIAAFPEGELMVDKLDALFAEPARTTAIPGDMTLPQGRIFTFGDTLFVTHNGFRFRVDLDRVDQSTIDLFPQGPMVDRLDQVFTPAVSRTDGEMPVETIVTGRPPMAETNPAAAGIDWASLHSWAGRVVALRDADIVGDPTVASRMLWIVSPAGTRHQLVLAEAGPNDAGQFAKAETPADNVLRVLAEPTTGESPDALLEGRLFFTNDTLWFARGNMIHEIQVSRVTSGELDALPQGMPVENVTPVFAHLLASPNPGEAGANRDENTVFEGQ